LTIKKRERMLVSFIWRWWLVFDSSWDTFVWCFIGRDKCGEIIVDKETCICL